MSRVSECHRGIFTVAGAIPSQTQWRNLVAHFPDAGVVYAPDRVLPNARHSMLPDWHIRNFSQSLHTLLDLDFDAFVPGRRAA